MMKTIFPILAILSLTALGIHARTWTSADGKSTFQGELISYNANTGEVTVDRDGKRITFTQQMLSASDITFLKDWKPSATSTTPELPGWKLVWSDEFDKTGAPDTKKWSYEKGLVRNNEKQYYTDKRLENARVEEGKLIIEARKEKFQNAEYTAASLTTQGRAEWKYGRIEVCAKLPAARGTWPAIWMLPMDIGKVPWPRCGEIDIMEHVGFDPSVIHGTLHTEAYNHMKKTQRATQIKLPTFSKNFHTYATEWSADTIVMQIDGKTFATYNKKPGDKEAEWPFDKPYYLILNLAIGGGWGGMKGIDDAAFPQRMEVDFVRVYQK
jgi:beta-glucanase (GH16 family)